jgi:ribonucleoside-diphosphate reductase alpha chain
MKDDNWQQSFPRQTEFTSDDSGEIDDGFGKAQVRRSKSAKSRSKSGATTPRLTENGLKVLKARYLLGNETPEDLFWRVAIAVAEPEKERDKWAQTFYSMMAETKFMPNSPTLFNAGTAQGTLSACFVIPIEDTMSSIMNAATTSAMIQKFGGGIGYSYSKLRGRGSQISTTQGRACGAVSVLKMLSSLSDMITQGGKRHGANMGILHIQHPEILEFIHMKDDDVTAQNFNISVAITDDFMVAIKQDAQWNLVDPHTEEVVHTVPARQLWEEIVTSAWKTGDPGLYFIDEANRHNPTPHLGQLESTNPCGEVPLLANEACNLGSINLAHFVYKDGRFDFAGLDKISRICARFLDNVVTVNKFPVQAVADAVAATRKIGLGVMGWHDVLIKMGIPYDSDQALNMADKVMGTINKAALETSLELANERGPYPACREETPIRNATRTCIAPTGSISAIAGCSSGIEPVFALAYVKNVLDGQRLQEVNPYLEEIARDRGFYSEEMMEEVARTGSIQHISQVPDDVKGLFKTALEVPYEFHIKMQAVFQKHTDLAVSKTINMRNDATKADVDYAYKMACTEKCRGITIYRNDSKSRQVLEVASPKTEEPIEALAEQPTETQATQISPLPRDRPRTIQGVTERIRTGHGNTYITINFDEHGRPFEVFTTLGKAGSCDAANLEAISRLVSLAIRSGVEVNEVIAQLRGITCHPAWDQGVLIKSAPDAVAVAMETHIKGESTESQKTREAFGQQVQLWNSPKPNGHTQEETKKASASTQQTVATRPACPECSGELRMQEGCAICTLCAWNECGG